MTPKRARRSKPIRIRRHCARCSSSTMRRAINPSTCFSVHNGQREPKSAGSRPCRLKVGSHISGSTVRNSRHSTKAASLAILRIYLLHRTVPRRERVAAKPRSAARRHVSVYHPSGRFLRRPLRGRLLTAAGQLILTIRHRIGEQTRPSTNSVIFQLFFGTFLVDGESPDRANAAQASRRPSRALDIFSD